MRIGWTKRIRITLLAALMLVPCAAVAADQEHDERPAFNRRIRELRERVENLRVRRDYLVFQKTMSAADSKYMVVNLSSRSGQLKYKDKVLKDFLFKPSANLAAHNLRPGMLTLSKKAEEKGGRNALVFGGVLILQWKRAAVPPQEAEIPFIIVTKRDLLSLFYAVEEGALLYIVR